MCEIERILVSVIIPVFNMEEYLEKCVSSVCRQTYSNLEIILVDDGSTDSSGTLCNLLAQKDKRIIVIHKNNGGLSDARNAGIDISKGKFIAFVDSDDYIADSFIKELLDVCVRNDVQIAQCEYYSVDKKSIPICPVGSKDPRIMSREEAIRECCNYTASVPWINAVVTWNKLYERSLFDNIRFPKGRIHEDEFTTYRLKWIANGTGVIARGLYYYNRREDGITGSKFKLGHLDKFYALEEKEIFLKTIGFEKEYKDTVIARYKCGLKLLEGLKKYYSDNPEIVNNFSDDMDECEVIIRTMDSLSKIEKTRLTFARMSENEKQEIGRVFGNLFPRQELGVSYLFPNELIPRNSRIVIYGAGKVGSDYYRQIAMTGNYELVCWVDYSWKERQMSGMPVLAPDRLLDTEYDYVIIANASSENAKIINENMVAWGVDPSKIVWKSTYIRSLDISYQAIEFCHTLRELSTSTKKVLLLNTADHGNMGDHALAIASKQFLEDTFSDRKVVEITGREWDSNKEAVISSTNKDDAICIVGGGFMGDLWLNEDTRVKDILSRYKDNHKILLPQTFYYMDVKMMETDMSFYRGIRNLLVIHREENSYSLFSGCENKSDNRHICFPDLALYLPFYESREERANLVMCLRKDKESLLREDSEFKETIIRLGETTGLRIVEIDTVLSGSVAKEKRKEELDKILKVFSSGKVVITDRLHGMLFAYLTGTPCIALDNISHKVGGVAKWIADSNMVKVVDKTDLNIDIFREMIGRVNQSGHRCRGLFEEMKVIIRQWVK